MNRDTGRQVWSRGAQPERTALAWTRTGLASAALLAVLVRQLLHTHPVAAVGLAVAAAPMVFGIAVAARARYRIGHDALHNGRSLPDARLAAACVLLTTLVAVTAAIYVVAG
jgi:uncharacterized membrane protein YidH (DUF202 family)